MVATLDSPDAFAAIGEGRRREILEFLAEGERPVNDVVASLGMSQPLVSKHLRVLREAGLVDVRSDGRRRLYSINGENMRSVHEWVRTFERFWDHKLARIKERAEHNAEAEARERARRRGEE